MGQFLDGSVVSETLGVEAAPAVLEALQHTPWGEAAAHRLEASVVADLGASGLPRGPGENFDNTWTWTFNI